MNNPPSVRTIKTTRYLVAAISLLLAICAVFFLSSLAYKYVPIFLGEPNIFAHSAKELGESIVFIFICSIVITATLILLLLIFLFNNSLFYANSEKHEKLRELLSVSSWACKYKAYVKAALEERPLMNIEVSFIQDRVAAMNEKLASEEAKITEQSALKRAISDLKSV